MEIELKNLSKQEFLALIKQQSKTISIQEKSCSRLEDQKTKLKNEKTRLKDEKTRLEDKVAELQHQVELLQRMQFGQKRERFEDPNQMALPLDVGQEIVEEQEEVVKQEITYSRAKKKHPGRAKLPGHLPVEEIEIYPKGDLSDKVCIGKEITDVLDYVPGHFKIKRYIRYKYATKDKDTAQITIGELPERIIDKGIPSEGLLSTIPLALVPPKATVLKGEHRYSLFYDRWLGRPKHGGLKATLRKACDGHQKRRLSTGR